MTGCHIIIAQSEYIIREVYDNAGRIFKTLNKKEPLQAVHFLYIFGLFVLSKR